MALRVLALAVLAGAPLGAQAVAPLGSAGRFATRPGVPEASGLWHVPGDFATVQDAIDGAAPDDRILIHGGTHASVTIDRPLTLIGDPAPLFVNGDVAMGATALAPIRLAGSGTGRVVLCDVEVGGVVDGFTYSITEAGIDGGGFEELHLYGCDVAGPTWILLTGIGVGAPGLSVDVDTLLVCGSSIAGAATDSDACYGSGPAGPPGIRAPGATTILLDSTVTGGGSTLVCGNGACPTGGVGGAGIECERLLAADSAIAGGSGAPWAYIDEGWELVPCGQAADGPAVVAATQVELPGGLAMQSATPRIGGTWTLSWETPGSAVLLVTREHSLAPVPLALLGWYFLDDAPAPPWLRGLPASGEQSFYLPASEAWIGYTFSAQVLDLANGLTRPVVDCIRP